MKPRSQRLSGMLAAALLATTVGVATPTSTPAQNATFDFDPNRVAVPNYTPNVLAAGLRLPTSAQTTALDALRASSGPAARVRWNAFAGSPEAISNIATAPFAGTAEDAARAFVSTNAGLFGVAPGDLALVDEKEALGGHLLRFQQRAGGTDVVGGGLGFVMTTDNRIRMVLGSTFRDVTSAASPSLDANTAIASAQARLAQYALARPASAEAQIAPAMDALAAQVAPVLRAPRLVVFPTPNGYSLAWDVITFSRNPFGLFKTKVDATTGQILEQEDLVRYQNPLPYTADIYPNHPTLANPDTGELALDANGEPLGLTRVQLRGYNPGTNATGVNGTLTGPHALVNNVLVTRQPFAQAAAGTWHFRRNSAPTEGQPNEADDVDEPSEHIDEVNLFFFINYLLEYVDDLHRRDDALQSRIGQGSFPDTYPNSDRPLVGLAHFPNGGPGVLGGPIDQSSPDAIVKSTLGFDNAFSLPVIETVDTPAGPQKVVVNPTVYGHGYLFNDLGKDGAVAYHEGMHSISTPIAGLEGAPEGGALNEAQADLWAYTITGANAIGEYVVGGSKVRDSFRAAGRDPNSLAWIRSTRTSLKYSQLGTRGNPAAFEVHRDGEIYVAALYDVRTLMVAANPQHSSLRPSFGDGNPTRRISAGQEAWERIFLGSLYILGLGSPDTFVSARDAYIEADRILYPTDPSDLYAPGQHEAMIWDVFAAHEVGTGAAAPNGGRQTISTRVTQFAFDQPKPAAPQNVTVTPETLRSLKVAWQPVAGAYAYEVFKRRVGTAGRRQFAGAPGREYYDGDATTNGWSHVAYVTGATASSYTDDGVIQEFYGPAGVSSVSDAAGFNALLGTEYAVRAIQINPSRQIGQSDLSGGASVSSNQVDVSAAIQTAFSNVRFQNGVFEFDQTLTNTGAQSPDAAVFSPIDFQIRRISSPMVTVANADNGGNGQSTYATFVYDQSLARGAVSRPRHLAFNNPGSAPFSFDAVVMARVRTAAVPATGSQPADGIGDAAPAPEFTTVRDTYNGTIVVGSAGSALVNGVDYVDVPFIARDGAFSVQGSLDASPVSAGAAPDMDFQLLDDQGHVLSTSGNLGPQEQVGAGVVPGRRYIYRVLGFASGPTQFVISSDQFVGASGGSTGGGSTFQPALPGVTIVKMVRFAVNPLTGTVSTRLL